MKNNVLWTYSFSNWKMKLDMNNFVNAIGMGIMYIIRKRTVYIFVCICSEGEALRNTDRVGLIGTLCKLANCPHYMRAKMGALFMQFPHNH